MNFILYLFIQLEFVAEKCMIIISLNSYELHMICILSQNRSKQWLTNLIIIFNSILNMAFQAWNLLRSDLLKISLISFGVTVIVGCLLAGKYFGVYAHHATLNGDFLLKR